MSDSINIKVDAGRFDLQLRQLFGKLKGLRRIHDAIGSALSERVRLGFKTSTGPYGRWASLSPATIRRRRNKSNQPLLDTGRLRNSITHEATPTSVRIGTNVEYAAYHQFGTQGLKSATSRVQPIDKRGRFKSRDKAGRDKKVTQVRFLNFQVGASAIPRRAFLPDEGLPAQWQQEDVVETVEAFLADGL